MNERATVLGSSQAIPGSVGRWRSRSMIWRVARKEFTEITRDGRFLWNCLIILALLVTAIGVGASRYEDDRALREAASREVREQWLKQGDKGPHTAGHYGVYAFKPATPLALFDPGINDYVGTIQYLEAHKENQASYKPAADSNALQRFGELSGAMVMQVLVPLLVILLCFSMISGEREDGTLRQLMSIGATPAALVWGKASGVGLVLGVVLLPSVIAGGVIASRLISDVDPHDMIDFPGKLVVLSLAYGLFFAAFAFVSLAVSIKARSSRAALTVLIGLWIVAGLLLPRVAADVGRTLHPTPSASEVAATIERARDAGPHAHEPNHPNHIAFRQKVLAQYGVQTIEELPVSFLGLALQADEEIGFKVFDEAYGGLRKQYKQQDTIQHLFGFVSPFISIRALSAALSGTDVDFANDFSEAGEAYRRNMVKVLNEDLIRNTKGMSMYDAEWGYKASDDLWAKVPPFDFDAPRLTTILGRNLIPISALLLWFAGSVALLRRAIKGMKVDI